MTIIKDIVKKWSVIIVGEILLLLTLVLQYTSNIIIVYTGQVLCAFFAFIIFYYYSMSKYKYQNNIEMSHKNRVLLTFYTIVVIVNMLGIFVELNYSGVTVGIAYIMIAIVGIGLIYNTRLFMKEEDNRWFKYLILIEFTFIYIGTALIANNWFFFVALPMTIVFTMYGKSRFLIISAVIQNLATIYSCICKLRIMPESENPPYFVAIYIVIVMIHICFSIVIICSSKMIGRANAKKRDVMLNRQEKMNTLSEEVIGIGKEIKTVAYKTSNVINDIGETSNNSKKVYQEIASSNKVNASSAQKQVDMTLGIRNMINGVELEVNRALDSTKSSISGVDKAKEAVNELKAKSNIIVDKNREVIVAFDDLVTSIKSVKSILGGVSDLSEHTNLLSLNAYIESAKAGENRKGFEVVASQISKLTDSTVSLTNDIYNIILNLENNTINARNVIGDILDMVDNENTVIDKTVYGFETIGNNISDLAKGINSIYDRIGKVVDYSSKIEEQAAKISKFSTIIESETLDVLNLNKDNQEKTKQTKISMDDLVNVVEELDEYI